MMFDAGFPQSFGGFVIGQLESDGGFELFELSGTNFDVKIVPFVGNFEDFWPRKTVDA